MIAEQRRRNFSLSWSKFDICWPHCSECGVQISHSRFHENRAVANRPSISMIAQASAGTGCKCQNRTTSTKAMRVESIELAGISASGFCRCGHGWQMGVASKIAIFPVLVPALRAEFPLGTWESRSCQLQRWWRADAGEAVSARKLALTLLVPRSFGTGSLGRSKSLIRKDGQRVTTLFPFSGGVTVKRYSRENPA